MAKGAPKHQGKPLIDWTPPEKPFDPSDLPVDELLKFLEETPIDSWYKGMRFRAPMPGVKLFDINHSAGVKPMRFLDDYEESVARRNRLDPS